MRLRHVPVIVYIAGILAVVYLWNTQWMPGNFTGEVQALTANVASPLDGMFMNLSVQQFDRVTNGQLIGKVALSPEVANAELTAIRADLLVLRARMIVDGQRNQLDYQQVRVDLLNQKVELAIARSKMRFAENERLRQENLRSEKIASEYDYEVALDQRDALDAEVKEREMLVAELERSLSRLRPDGATGGELHVLDIIDAAIAAQEERFRQSAQTYLPSPIDGVVTRIYRNQGENISAGEVLITISSDRSDSIVGFIRQPISFEPKPGDTVIVRTRRGGQRRAAEARIVKVGGRLEFFTQSLRVRGFDSSQERGLPVLIGVPQDLALYPGELVDLALKN